MYVVPEKLNQTQNPCTNIENFQTSSWPNFELKFKSHREVKKFGKWTFET